MIVYDTGQGRKAGRKEVSKPENKVKSVKHVHNIVDADLDEEPIVFEEPVVEKKPKKKVKKKSVNDKVDKVDKSIKQKSGVDTVSVIDKSSEPTDIRLFLKKHPNSAYDFVLQYFTKKQINDAIKIGRIIKKGNTLRI